MSEIAVEFDHVWKKFRKGEVRDSLRDLIPAIAHGLFSRNSTGKLNARDFWALRDISIEVKYGDALGIIGPNGAGKSTILKLLSGIMKPTQGTIRANGRLSALIEVGAGFHPDLTGRENVYLNGSILGMKKKEIDAKFDEIVEFAGISDFIDTPVKRYSSGMYARLGFAVAAHVDPEILLVDEVLSVGDMQFQEKCLERMQRVVHGGTTVVFVSHNLAAVDSVCPTTALVSNGRIAMLGPTRDVTREYVGSVQGGDAQPGSDLPIRNVRFEREDGSVAHRFLPGERAYLKFRLEATVPLEECILAFIIRRASDGLDLCDYNLHLKDLRRARDTSEEMELTLSFDINLLRGAYVVLLNLYHCPTSSFPVRHLNAGFFSVDETSSYSGIAHLNPQLEERGRT